MKRCIYCKHFGQLRFTGGDKWYNYCKIGRNYYPCGGEKCEHPKYYKEIRNKEEEK